MMLVAWAHHRQMVCYLVFGTPLRMSYSQRSITRCGNLLRSAYVLQTTNHTLKASKQTARYGLPIDAIAEGKATSKGMQLPTETNDPGRRSHAPLAASTWAFPYFLFFYHLQP